MREKTVRGAMLGLTLLGWPASLGTAFAGTYAISRGLNLPAHNKSLDQKMKANAEWKRQKLLEADKHLAICAKSDSVENCMTKAQEERADVEKTYGQTEKLILKDREELEYKTCLWLTPISVPVALFFVYREL